MALFNTPFKTAIRSGILLATLHLLANTSHAYDGEFAAVSPNGEGAVATINPLATQAGIDAIENGGNAIDAAVAAALTLGVVDSHNSGIGGGAFILVRYVNGKVEAIDGREMAPAAAHRDMYIIDGVLDKKASKTGALAAGIPGSLAAFEYLVDTTGKKTWSSAFEHGIHYAENGFPIDPVLAKRLSRTEADIRQFPETAKIYLDGNQKVPTAGSLQVQKDLAETYKKLAQQGSRYFYQGEFATKTAKWMKKNGGIITARDFANYHIKKREPVSGSYRGNTIISYPPPSSGGIHIVQMLGMLEEFDVANLSDVDRYHLLAEVMDRAFADRAYWLGDSDFVPVPKGLTENAYLTERMNNFSMNKASQDINPGRPKNPDTNIFDKHTTHIAAADKDGNWVAITTTLNTSFGSKVVIPTTGVLLNNQMDDFSIQPGVPNAFGLVGNEANAIAPGKRPLSSMSPTIVLKNGQPIMTLGAAGGPTIITQVLQNIINVIDLDMDAEQALATLRVHQQWKPDVLMVEESLPAGIKQGLEAKGHKLYPRSYLGASQMILLKDGEFWPAAEPRIQAQHKQ
jgi:gamma-glutamyltranspeptidase/glutathione hydrolase